MSLSLNPRRCGTVVAIDGRETWLIHNHLNREDETFESVDRDWSIRAILGVGTDFEYDILSKEDWVGRRLVANAFRKKRAFICGDAAHLWMPYAGYGMNAGIADAANLAWSLAAYLRGWADPAILDAYEAERLPITDQVSRFAMDMAMKVLGQRRAVPEEIESAGPEGDAVRARVGRGRKTVDRGPGQRARHRVVHCLGNVARGAHFRDGGDESFGDDRLRRGTGEIGRAS